MAEGSWGCPECGCYDFNGTESKSWYGTEDMHGTWSGVDAEDCSDYEIDDCYGMHIASTHINGDVFEHEIECTDCEHEYTKPKWYPNKMDPNALATLFGISEEELDELCPAFGKFVVNAKDIKMESLPHCILFIIQAKIENPDKHNTTFVDPETGVKTAIYNTKEIISKTYHASDKMGKMHDRRLFPVMIQLDHIRGKR